MQGYVELSKENGYKLIKDCLHSMDNYDYQYKSYTVKMWFGLKTKEVKECTNTPHWYSSQQALKRKLNSLKDMLDKGDPVHLSLLCYEEIIKLSVGDRRANAVYILNY